MLERTYTHAATTYRIPNASEFFAAFSRKLSDAKLPHWNDKSELWTKVVLKGLLEDLGKEHGFEPESEWPFRIDQTWNIMEEGQANSIEVAIEHETDADWQEVLRDEGSKLMDVKARLKVVIFYPDLHNFEKFTDKFSTEIRIQELKVPQERYLAIGICSDQKNKQLVVKGTEIAPSGTTSSLRAVTIPYAEF